MEGHGDKREKYRSQGLSEGMAQSQGVTLLAQKRGKLQKNLDDWTTDFYE